MNEQLQQALAEVLGSTIDGIATFKSNEYANAKADYFAEKQEKAK